MSSKKLLTAILAELMKLNVNLQKNGMNVNFTVKGSIKGDIQIGNDNRISPQR